MMPGVKMIVVGEKYKIRSVVDLINEFGLRGAFTDGRIPCDEDFILPNMLFINNMVVTIKSIRHDRRIIVEEDVDHWALSIDMIEDVDKHTTE